MEKRTIIAIVVAVILVVMIGVTIGVRSALKDTRDVLGGGNRRLTSEEERKIAEDAGWNGLTGGRPYLTSEQQECIGIVKGAHNMGTSNPREVCEDYCGGVAPEIVEAGRAYEEIIEACIRGDVERIAEEYCPPGMPIEECMYG